MSSSSGQHLTSSVLTYRITWLRIVGSYVKFWANSRNNSVMLLNKIELEIIINYLVIHNQVFTARDENFLYGDSRLASAP